MTRLVLTAFAALALPACDAAGGPPAEVTFDATVVPLVLDGPAAYLLAAPDAHYYPLNLPASFQEEGARVRVEGLVKDYRVYFEPALEITSIVRRP